ncbi:NUDIX domain-containing protein [Paenibacillus silvisoli]|uniref:NUDIX domain-containing protein n=1 Tax=Paenibacillus silvisoli TaxID=3110539 RepID=UPI002805824F|nr:NUDIX domain-containing protein [Paenibacillus silvisoli]
MHQPNVLGKATCFITRERDSGTELLLFRHPKAGIQLPAGTVELDETYEQAALREAFEETGLSEFQASHYIGKQDTTLSGEHIIYRHAKVYSRPDLSSSSWAEIRRGITVQEVRREGKFIQASYAEEDQYPDPNYISYQITGWMEEENLTTRISRHFYHLRSTCDVNEWKQEADHHLLTLFWAPLHKLPEIVYPQNKWVTYVREELKYAF